MIISSVLFLAVFAYFEALHRVFFTPDQFFVVAFVIVIFLGQTKKFLVDWTPLVLLILMYEYMRGLIPLVNKHIHFNLMPRFDQLIFGGKLPSAVLQNALYSPGHIHWYDYASLILYISHFIVPLTVGFFLWQVDRSYFRKFAAGMVGLSYLTFSTYLVFPAAPPWMASQLDIIPHVEHITDIVLQHLFPYISVFTLYKYFGANLTAAVPSLHAAFPLLTSLFLGARYRKLIPVLVLYVAGVWFAVIYLGEHYVFDVVLGAIYALFIYALIQRAAQFLNRRRAATTLTQSP